MSCNCGCGGCQTKIQGPLLTEGKVKSLLSEGLLYHIEHKLPLFETVYRIGSDAHLALIKEARKLYSRNVIDLCEEDEALIGTHLGEFGIYEGESVPLDLPMLNESKYDKEETIQQTIDRLKARIEDPNDGGNVPFLIQKIKDLEKSLDEAYSGFLRNPEDPDSEKFEPTGSVAQFREELRALFGKFKGDLKNPEFIKGVAQIMVNWKSLLRSQMDEAEFKGKDVPLNKPKRGGSKAYYVYVRDPKTKKVKKVSFGSGGLRAKIKNKEARNAFAKRHNCKDKKDRTKAGYWSCNLPRYASALGLGANMNTFW